LIRQGCALARASFLAQLAILLLLATPIGPILGCFGLDFAHVRLLTHAKSPTFNKSCALVKTWDMAGKLCSTKKHDGIKEGGGEFEYLKKSAASKVHAG
jgi:hypothetical protein